MEFCFLEAIRIDHLGWTKLGAGNGIWAIKVGVPMKMVLGFKDLDKPAEGFDPLVGEIFLIMDQPGRRMGYKKIHKAAMLQTIEHQGGDQTVDVRPHLALGILEWTSFVVADAALNPSQQSTLVMDHLAV